MISWIAEGPRRPDVRIDQWPRRRGARILTAALAGAALFGPTVAAAQHPFETEPQAVLLQPGDIVRLSIWREPDLSGDFIVDEKGVVVFPKIGPRQVTRQSPEVLEEQLINAYREYLRNPSIDVTLLRRINVLGAVHSPNVYSVDPTMTLAEVIAMAGGITDAGNPEKIEVYRNGEKVPLRFNPRTRIGDTPIRSGDHVYVPQRNWLLRNSGIATLISTSVTLFIALFTR